MRFGKRQKRVVTWTIGIAFLWFLLTPQRFSSIGYSVIKERDIPASILGFVTKNNGVEDLKHFGINDTWHLLKRNKKYLKHFCRIDNDYTDNEATVSLYPSESLVNKSLSKVTSGGRWAPTDCKPRIKVLIIIPYRERKEQLDTFLKIMHIFLQKQNLEYSIIVSEQSKRNQFNRAKLFNIGYLESKSLYEDIPCVIFHDVDLIPLDYRNIYGCSVEGPRHLSANLRQFRYLLPYENLFGGAIAVSTKVFESINGFSNEYFGWGGEDDDFRVNRMANYEIVRFEPSISSYTMLPHKKAVPNPKRFDLLSSSVNVTNELQPRYKNSSDQNQGFDGLSNAQYNLISIVKRKLYTHILSDF